MKHCIICFPITNVTMVMRNMVLAATETVFTITVSNLSEVLWTSFTLCDTLFELKLSMLNSCEKAIVPLVLKFRHTAVKGF